MTLASRQKPTRFFIIPGLGNSGPDHWQTHLQRRFPSFTRVEQNDWEAPDCVTWVNTLTQALAGEDLSQVVLIAHSLGCVLVAQWASQQEKQLRGALLVAPGDVETPLFRSFPSTGFDQMPLHQLPFPSKVVASTTDEWLTLARAQQFAAAWGSELVNVSPAGHLNTASGHGSWPASVDLIREWL